MADVTVKYKGNTIAEMDDSGTKTLKTSGKYCEGDISVTYAVKETGLENVRRWDVTIGAVADTETTAYFFTWDEWLGANRDNPNLCIAILPKFTIKKDTSKEGVSGIYLASNMAIMQNGSGVNQKSLSAYVNKDGVIVPRMRTPQLAGWGENIGDICVTPSGALYAMVANSYPLAQGDYVVIAWIA